MEINVSTDIVPLPYVSSKTGPPQTPRPVDTTTFAGADRLDQSLRATPEVRPAAVARAQELIGDVAYPPAATLRGIAALLAMHLDNNES